MPESRDNCMTGHPQITEHYLSENGSTGPPQNEILIASQLRQCRVMTSLALPDPRRQPVIAYSIDYNLCLQYERDCAV